MYLCLCALNGSQRSTDSLLHRSRSAGNGTGSTEAPSVTVPNTNGSPEDAAYHAASSNTPSTWVEIGMPDESNHSRLSSSSGLTSLVSNMATTISEVTNMDTMDAMDDSVQLDRPCYAFAKIDAFFSHARSTSDAGNGRATMADLEESHCGPFPDLPRTAVTLQSREAFTELLMENQQTYFLRLFWETYHPLVQVSDEFEFLSLLDLDRHQASEKQGDAVRALTDCMTALGIQYGQGAGLVPRSLCLKHATDVSLIGYEYFNRCRDQITSLNPLTLMAMWCYALMALYLLNANDFGEAYSLLGTAIRNGHRANLHQEPSGRSQPRDSTARRRIWWLLYMLDARCSQQLGKPIAVQSCAITCAIPSDGELATIPGNAQVCWKNLNVSTYFIHAVKLAVCSAEIRNLNLTSELWENTSNVVDPEQQANALASALGALEEWRNQLPKELLNPRKDAGFANSMSIEESPVVLYLGAPSWLHHQRLLLEIYYHNTYIMLQRPFICFSRVHDFSPIQHPQADHHARSALKHAIALATIIHDVCSLSDVLFGLCEILHPLWNATMTTFAFAIAKPFCWRSIGARQSIHKALAVFEVFATTDPFAAQAKEITQVLVLKLDHALANLNMGNSAALRGGGSSSHSLSQSQSQSQSQDNSNGSRIGMGMGIRPSTSTSLSMTMPPQSSSVGSFSPIDGGAVGLLQQQHQQQKQQQQSRTREGVGVGSDNTLKMTTDHAMKMANGGSISGGPATDTTSVFMDDGSFASLWGDPDSYMVGPMDPHGGHQDPTLTVGGGGGMHTRLGVGVGVGGGGNEPDDM